MNCLAALGIKKRSQKKMANKKETKTHFNYNRLWKLLIDRGMDVNVEDIMKRVPNEEKRSES